MEALVDITRLPDRDGIRQDGEMITLEACITHAQTALSPLVREKAAILAIIKYAQSSLEIYRKARFRMNLRDR